MRVHRQDNEGERIPALEARLLPWSHRGALPHAEPEVIEVGLQVEVPRCDRGEQREEEEGVRSLTAPLRPLARWGPGS